MKRGVIIQLPSKIEGPYTILIYDYVIIDKGWGLHTKLLIFDIALEGEEMTVKKLRREKLKVKNAILFFT